MQIAQDRHARSAFPFRGARGTMAAMAVEVHRDASLALRERNGIVRVRVNWPAAEAGGLPAVLVFLSDADVVHGRGG